MMKISKKHKSSKSTTPVTSSKYQEGTDYIKSAITSLGQVAKDDILAKEAIANLSVILFELQDQ